MSQRKFIFRGGSRELVLPVTPESYRVETGTNIEVVNIHELGDAVLVGYGTLATIEISCLFPEHGYPFSRDSGAEDYIAQFERWIRKKQKLRFVVGNTGVNVPVVVQSISYGERDGTNDVYADIILREYTPLKAVKVSSPAATKPREPVVETSAASVGHYTIKAGDTLSAICRKEYGGGSEAVYSKLAARNGISNPNLIYAGTTLELPHPLL